MYENKHLYIVDEPVAKLNYKKKEKIFLKNKKVN